MRKATPVTSPVLPGTHVLAYLAKWTLRVVILLGALLALAGQAAAAPVVFEASGEFEEAALSGTLTIDTATGKLLSSDLIITWRSDEFVFTDVVESTATNGQPGTKFTGAVSAPNIGIVSFQLTIPAPTLVGYKGGKFESLVSERNPSWWSIWDGVFVYSDGFPLETGTLEPQ